MLLVVMYVESVAAPVQDRDAGTGSCSRLTSSTVATIFEIAPSDGNMSAYRAPGSPSPIDLLLKIALEVPELIFTGRISRRAGLGRFSNSGALLSDAIQLEMWLRISSDGWTKRMPAPFLDSDSHTT